MEWTYDDKSSTMRTKPDGLRVATIADVHGNLLALEAVLARLEAESVDAIVVAGDVASGPQPAETVERLMSLERARFIRGNGDREAVQAFDERWPFDPADDHSRKDASWFAHGITRGQRGHGLRGATRCILGNVGSSHRVPAHRLRL